MKAIFLHMIDGLVKFSVHDKRARSTAIDSHLSNLQLRLPSISNHPGNLLSILFALVLLNASLVFAKPPEFTNCPTSPITNSHCKAFTYRFVAVDPDGDSVRYELSSGPGYIDSIYGIWAWRDATEENVGQKLAITVRAVTARGKAKCTADIEVTNQSPTLIAGCSITDTVLFGMVSRQNFNHTDDCGSSRYRIVSKTAGINGRFEIDSIHGNVSIEPGRADLLLKQPLAFTIIITDEAGASDSCSYFVHLLPRAPLSVSFGEVTRSYTLNKQTMTVPILISAHDSVSEIGGFDLRISFPSQYVSLDTIVRGALYDSCKWDYFTFRKYPLYNSPSTGDSILRIVGLKKVYYPDRGPRCPNPTSDPISIATLTFSAPECIFGTDWSAVPIRFFWESCEDNTISPADLSQLYIGANVFDAEEFAGGSSQRYITDQTVGFPTVTGPQSECLLDTIIHREGMQPTIDFYNQSLFYFDNSCIDVTGDINVNGIQYELADLVMFIDYFRAGLSAFGWHKMGSTVVSDINRDGIPLTIADLILMGEIVYGDTELTTSGQPKQEGGK
jgi:hypothetical protein